MSILSHQCTNWFVHVREQTFYFIFEWTGTEMDSEIIHIHIHYANKLEFLLLKRYFFLLGIWQCKKYKVTLCLTWIKRENLVALRYKDRTRVPSSANTFNANSKHIMPTFH